MPYPGLGSVVRFETLFPRPERPLDFIRVEKDSGIHQADLLAQAAGYKYGTAAGTVDLADFIVLTAIFFAVPNHSSIATPRIEAGSCEPELRYGAQTASVQD